MEEYVRPEITPLSSRGGSANVQGCTVAAIVLAVIIAAAGAYVGVGFAYGGLFAFAAATAAWYATVSASCVNK